MKLSIYIPLSPPGINRTYAIGVNKRTLKRYFYKTAEAERWAAQAALIVGYEAASQGWEDKSEYYEIYVKLSNWRLDVDAPMKLILDVISQKLNFNDNRILKQCSEKVESKEEGVWVELKPYKENEI